MEYIHNMTFSLLCYISARDNKGRWFNLIKSEEILLLQIFLDIIISYSYPPEYFNQIYGLMYNRACEL